jgi:hypothetical protein
VGTASVGCAPTRAARRVEARASDCQQGRGPACLRYLRQRHPHLSPQARREKLRRLLRAACAAGSGRACFGLAQQLRAHAHQAGQAFRDAVVYYNHARFHSARAQNGNAVTHTIRYRYTFKLAD